MKTSVFKNPETMPTNRANEEIRLLRTLKRKKEWEGSSQILFTV